MNIELGGVHIPLKIRHPYIRVKCGVDLTHCSVSKISKMRDRLLYVI